MSKSIAVLFWIVVGLTMAACVLYAVGEVIDIVAWS